MKGLGSADDVTGPYNVIARARAQARNLDELAKLVVAQFQALDGVTHTLVCAVVHLE